MKNYNVLDYSNWIDLANAIDTDISENISFPISAKHKLFGSCTIESIQTSLFDSKADFIISIKFDSDQIKKYSLITLLSLKHLILEDSVLETFQNYITLISGLHSEKMVLVRAEYQKKFEAEQQAKADAKKAKSLEAKKRQVEAKINNLAPATLTSDYAVIGWLARNVSTISASINSDYEEWFKKNFGIVEHSVIDASAKTANGDLMKYSISFRASFKSELPASLQSLAGVDKKVIHSVEYIWNLIDKYGFRFGKTQDIDLIKSHIPTEYLTDFETGYGPDPEPKSKKSRAPKKLAPVT